MTKELFDLEVCFSSPQCPYQLWGPLTFLRTVPVIKQPLTLHVLSRLRMGGVVLLYPHMTLWHAQAQIYIIYFFCWQSLQWISYTSSSGH